MLAEAFEWIDQQQNRITQDLIHLASINSGSRNNEGLAKCAQWLTKNMALPGSCHEQIELEPVEECDDHGKLVRYATQPALLWTARKESTHRLLLAIHYDTVFGVDHPFQKTTMLDSERLQGPGVADAKGGILVIRTALQAIEKFNLAGSLGWSVLLNPDEEIGSPHSTDLFHRIANDYRSGLLFEPALPSGHLVSTRGGSGNYSIVVRGRSAHVGRHFDEGRNAIARLSELVVGLDGLNGNDDGFILNAGFVSGGGPLNVVPDFAIGRFNVRVSRQEQVAWFEGILHERLAELERTDGYEVAVYGGVTSPPKVMSPALEQLKQQVEAAHATCGHPPVEWIHTQGVCDGNKLAAAGLPNIDSLGPIGGGLHSSNEWVQLPSIVERAKVIVAMIQTINAQL